MGGRGYPWADSGRPPSGEGSEVTVVDVQGESVYNDVIRPADSTVSLTDLLGDDEGQPRGIRGWRLA